MMRRRPPNQSRYDMMARASALLLFTSDDAQELILPRSNPHAASYCSSVSEIKLTEFS
jgi:hypothetical protein